MTDNAVILAPGFLEPFAAMTPLADRFSDEGFSIRYLGYDALGSDNLTDIARKNLHRVRSMKLRHDHITFIGHSLGARIGMKMMELEPDIFGSFVSIASPYGKVPLVATGANLGPFQRLLAKRFPLIEELAHDRDVPPHTLIPTLAISAQFDGMRAPISNSPGIKDHTTIPMSGHTSILFLERTFLEIFGWLKYGVLSSAESVL